MKSLNVSDVHLAVDMVYIGAFFLLAIPFIRELIYILYGYINYCYKQKQKYSKFWLKNAEKKLINYVAFLFSFGFVTTILEIHLTTFRIDHVYVSLLLALQSGIYLTCCLSAGYIFKNIDERTCMFGGAVSLSIAYLMLGPYSAIFPKEICP